MTVELIPAARINSAVMAAMHHICFASPWNEEAFATSLAQPDTFGLIAVAGGAMTPSLKDTGPAGLILWRLTLDEAEILTIAVLPPWRRNGLGRRMLQAAIDAVARQGVKVMFLEVAANNLAAQNLYRKMKFAQVGLRKGYYADADALVMRLDL